MAAENNGKDYQTKEEIIAHKFASLRGETITPYAAQKSHNIGNNELNRVNRIENPLIYLARHFLSAKMGKCLGLIRSP